MPYDAPKNPLFLRLSPADDVVIALRDIAAGTRLETEGVTAAEKILKSRLTGDAGKSLIEEGIREVKGKLN